jgi:membrane-bound inhibitor of C-type lysozyme
MKRVLIACLPALLAGCSYYNQFVERMNTDTLNYQCDEKPLTVKLNHPRQEVSFIYDNTPLILKQGLSASGHATLTVFMFSGRRVMAPRSTSAIASY